MILRRRIIKMRENGLTQSEIGLILGVTGERVRQIEKGDTNKKTRPLGDAPPLSTGDVARLLNIHTNTVRRWTQIGLLKAFRVGPRGDRRFRLIEVEKLIQQKV